MREQIALALNVVDGDAKAKLRSDRERAVIEIIHMQPKGLDFSVHEFRDGRDSLQAIDALQAARQVSPVVVVVPVWAIKLNDKAARIDHAAQCVFNVMRLLLGAPDVTALKVWGVLEATVVVG